MDSLDLWRWLGLGAGALALAAFDLGQRRRATARQRHAHLRSRWLDAMLARPGQEIVAVQTIRNSVMAATIVASTTVIALMGTISLIGPVALHIALNNGEMATPIRVAIGALIVATLFTAFILATQSARFYNHLGYLVGFGTGIAATDREVAQRYVALAGRYYSDSLRTLFYLAPLVVGLMEPLAVLPGVFLIIAALVWFDRGGPRA